jgi:hypothetical protein
MDQPRLRLSSPGVRESFFLPFATLADLIEKLPKPVAKATGFGKKRTGLYAMVLEARYWKYPLHMDSAAG